MCFAERLVADDVDARDLRGIAFDDVDVHRDAVALLRRDGRRHLRRILAFRDVLALHFLLRAVERGTVEYLRFGQADVLQRLLERIGVEFLVARDVDLADRRPLLNEDNQHAAFDLQSHVAKEACREQSLHRGSGFCVVDAIAYLDRKIGEDGARFGPLDALDTNILHHERLECPHRLRNEPEKHRGKQHEDRAAAPGAAPAGVRTNGRGH